MWWWSGWWGVGWMWFFWLVVLGLLIWLLVRIPSGSYHGGPPVPHETAEDILRKRYARGEIGREEFEQKMEDLKRH